MMMMMMMRPSFLRDRLARSDEDLLRRARGGESSVSNKTSASEDKTPADGLGNREAGLHFPRSYALLEAFDAGDMLGFLSAWAVSKTLWD